MTFPDRGNLLDLLTGSIATLALFLAYMMLPVVGLVPGIFGPFPAMYFYLKRGKVTGTAIVVTTAVVLSLLDDVAGSLLYVLQCGVVSLMLPAMLRTGKKGARSIAISVGINVVLIVMLAGSFWVIQGVNPHDQIVKGIQASITQTGILYEKAGVTGEELKMLQQAMLQAGALIGRIYPSLIVVTIAIIAGLNLSLLKRTFVRLTEPPEVGEFSRFKNPEQLVWLLIAAGFSMLMQNQLVTTTALNLLIVTLSLYFVQGMAIIVNLFKKIKVPRFARGLFYVVLAVQPYLAGAVAALGIFDIWGDFRTPKHQENL
jgi:uncharacterized protein YybS (DUF2232 family)